MSTDSDKKLIRLIPNGLTIGRLILTIVFLIMILYAPDTGQEKPAIYLLAAFVIFLIAGISDIIDGKLARMFDVTSKFGRIVDPLADKILVCGAFVCFAIVKQPRFANFDLGPIVLGIIHWSVAVIIIAREFFVTILRQIAEARGVNFAATTSGKIKMFLQSFGIGTVVISWGFVYREWGDWFTLAVFLPMITVTVVSGVRAIQRPRK